MSEPFPSWCGYAALVGAAGIVLIRAVFWRSYLRGRRDACERIRAQPWPPPPPLPKNDSPQDQETPSKGTP